MARSRLSEDQTVDQDFASEAELTTVSGFLHHRIKGRYISDEMPADGEVLIYSTATEEWYPATISGGELYSHSDLQDLNADDHWLYVPRDGSRGFTSTVSGIDPTAFYHLTTKQYVDTISGTLQEQFTHWRRIHVTATGDLGTGGIWADHGTIHDIPVTIFDSAKTEQLVLTYRSVDHIHIIEHPSIVIITSSIGTAPQAGDAVRWKLEGTHIGYGESLGKAADETVYLTQTLDDSASYLFAETRNTDITFTFDINLMALHDLLFMKLTRLGADVLDTFSGEMAISEIWMVYYGT
jgi:hypothetical protein